MYCEPALTALDWQRAPPQRHGRNYLWRRQLMALPPRLPRPLGIVLTGALTVLALFGPARTAMTPSAQAQAGTVKMEWLGWSHFRFTSPGGKVVLTNPFIEGNPDAAVSVDDITQADLIVLADGHRDEVGSAVAIAQKTGAKLFQPFELGSWLIEQGVPMGQVQRSSPGARLR